ncbi:MAG TPA: lasso peptide biosynthesis B2 protein [Solirubrobacteraceae bacterium]|nr:lasso peptide biosynthesis B2 protein [Solirubrobacteraceae bacterium]
MRARASLADLRAAAWAHRALGCARRQLSAGRVAGIILPPPPELRQSAWRGAAALLRRRRHTCLEAALVRQRWLSAHGVERQIVIGVASPRDEFVAHAWVEGEDVAGPERFLELTRIP